MRALDLTGCPTSRLLCEAWESQPRGVWRGRPRLRTTCQCSGSRQSLTIQSCLAYAVHGQGGPAIKEELTRLSDQIPHHKLARNWQETSSGETLDGRMRMDILETEPCCRSDRQEAARKGEGVIDLGSNLNRATPVVGDEPLTKAWLDRMSGKRFKLYLYGSFVYRDIFGDGHSADVCAYYRPDSVNELFLWSCHNPESNSRD